MTATFNRFVDAVARAVAHAGFFIFCVLVIVVWAPSIAVLHNIDTWQLIINTLTTIITFLLVALLHSSQHRFESATNERLHHLEESIGDGDPVDDPGQRPDQQEQR